MSREERWWRLFCAVTQGTACRMKEVGQKEYVEAVVDETDALFDAAEKRYREIERSVR